jgi:hypothetical protein
MNGMEVHVSLGGGQGDLADLKNLEDWLLNDPLLAGCAVTRPVAAPEPGQMGAVSDVLVVALGSGGAGAALASSLSVWLRTRVGDLSVRIRTDQGEVEVRTHNVRDAESLIRQVVPLVPGSDPWSS